MEKNRENLKSNGVLSLHEVDTLGARGFELFPMARKRALQRQH